jgi:glutamate decarboxylase
MTDATFTLNFSTGSSMVVAQYYNFVRCGRAGYSYIMKNMQQNPRVLAEKLQDTGRFSLIGRDEEQLPLVAFQLSDNSNFNEFDVAWQLSPNAAGWSPRARSHPTPKTSRSCGRWSRRP